MTEERKKEIIDVLDRVGLREKVFKVASEHDGVVSRKSLIKYLSEIYGEAAGRKLKYIMACKKIRFNELLETLGLASIVHERKTKTSILQTAKIMYKKAKRDIEENGSLNIIRSCAPEYYKLRRLGRDGEKAIFLVVHKLWREYGKGSVVLEKYINSMRV